MKKSLVITMVVVASIVLTVGIVKAATTHNVTSLLGGVSGDHFDVDGTMVLDSLKVGAQGVGGVTYFNGTIINETTGEGDADIPVTFGDNVRIDGRVYRGATAGTSDSMPFIVNDNMEVTGTLTVAGLGGTGIVASDNIADDAVTADKINGTGGANLPIAYGNCNSDGSTGAATSNVTCSWDGGSGWYAITIDGESYYYQNYVPVVTSGGNNYIADTSSVGGDFLVDFEDDAGNAGLQTDFSFVIYKP